MIKNRASEKVFFVFHGEDFPVGNFQPFQWWKLTQTVTENGLSGVGGELLKSSTGAFEFDCFCARNAMPDC